MSYSQLSHLTTTPTTPPTTEQVSCAHLCPIDYSEDLSTVIVAGTSTCWVEQMWPMNMARISLPSTPPHPPSGNITSFSDKRLSPTPTMWSEWVWPARCCGCWPQAQQLIGPHLQSRSKELGEWMPTQGRTGRTLHGALKYSCRGRRGKELSFPHRWWSCDMTQSSQQAPLLKL